MLVPARRTQAARLSAEHIMVLNCMVTIRSLQCLPGSSTRALPRPGRSGAAASRAFTIWSVCVPSKARSAGSSLLSVSCLPAPVQAASHAAEQGPVRVRATWQTAYTIQGQIVFSKCDESYARRHSFHSTAYPVRHTSPVAWYASCSGLVASCFVIKP